MLLSEIGEDALVDELTKGLEKGRNVIVGVGDDCAVLRGDRPGWRSLLKTDCIVEGVHFTMEASPVDIGWKAMARAVSDIAAMGGKPREALVTVVLHSGMSLRTAKGIYRGLSKAAGAFGISIVGGETSSSVIEGTTMISIALTGEVESRRCLLRSGGRAGDALYVTGRLGGASAGRHLRIQPRLEESSWLAKHFPVHAMMDLSDGLAKDLPRLARASGVGFHLVPDDVPRNRGCDLAAALGEGEDHELLFAISSRRAASLEERWKRAFPRLPLTRIGGLVEDVKAGADLDGGWDHFSGD